MQTPYAGDFTCIGWDGSGNLMEFGSNTKECTGFAWDIYGMFRRCPQGLYAICIGFGFNSHSICIEFELVLDWICIEFALHLHWIWIGFGLNVH